MRFAQKRLLRVYARAIKLFPEAEKIVIVQDNLNTHNPSSFYENITASEALELMKRFEMNYTSIKGSWLDMAEAANAAFSFDLYYC